MSPAPTVLSAPVMRRLAATGSTLSTLLLIGAGIWLTHPQARPLAARGTPLDLLLGGPNTATSLIAATMLTVVAATTLTVGVTALAGRARGVLTPTLAFLAAAAVMFTLLGVDALVVAGYTFAFLIPVGIVVGTAALIPRKPGTGVLLVVALAMLVLAGITGVVPFGDVYRRFGAAIVESPLHFGATLGLILFAGVWMLWASVLLTRRLPMLGEFVGRHRVPITVAAAACSAPYALARASWLTPWPLFGGSQEMFDADPAGRVLGLMLGAAILTGGVLTLGLILPWGSRVPRWVPLLSGRRIPVGFAVVPATTVALLFTAAGIDMVARVVGEGLSPLILLVLPLWLWGPLLGLATWGYAHHRGRTSR